MSNLERNQAITKLGNFEFAETVTGRTTHLITSEPRRTINLLRGLIRGLWILEFEWIGESIQSGRWLLEEPFEFRKFSRAIEVNIYFFNFFLKIYIGLTKFGFL